MVNDHTLALGFNVDFSEDNDPTEELGDRPAPPETEPAPTQSEVDDAELPGRREGFAASLAEDNLPDIAESKDSSAGHLFPGTEDEGSYVVAPRGGPFTCTDGCTSAKTHKILHMRSHNDIFAKAKLKQQ